MIASTTANNSTDCMASSSGIGAPDILLLIIGSLAALLNGFLLLVIYNERKKLFNTRVSYLVANLSLADCLTGVVLVLVMILNMTNREDNLHGVQFYLLCASIQISFLTLILMTIDRLVVVVLPMTWSRVLTVKRTIIGIIIAWILPICGAVVLYHHQHKRRLIMLLFWGISVVLFISSHVFIFKFLTKQRRRLSQVTILSNSTEVTTVVDLALQASHAQITSVVLTVMLVLIITYIPYIIYSTILMAYRGTDMDVRIINSVFRYTQAFSYLNYVVNPIIYAWRLRIYRKAFYKMIKLI